MRTDSSFADATLNTDSPVGVDQLPVDPLDQALYDLHRVNQELICRLQRENQET